MHQHPSRGRVFVSACLCLSAMAIAALAYLESATARADLRLWPTSAVHAVKSVHRPTSSAAETATTPPAKDLELAPLPTVAKATAQPLAAPVAPDFTGKRLSVARREARKLGVKLIARDQYGQRVPAEDARYYRVRKQKTAPGAPLAQGDTIEVRVREAPVFAAGY